MCVLFFFIVSASLLVCVQSGDGSTCGAFLQQRDQIVHQRQFLFAAFAPAQIERFHQVGELFAVKDQAVEDGVHKGSQGVVGQAVAAGDGGKFGSVALVLESLVAGAHLVLGERPAGFKRPDVGGDLVEFVHELGVGADEADELVPAHLLLGWRLPAEAGDEVHDIVVIDVGRGKEDELEVELVNRFFGRVTSVLILRLTDLVVTPGPVAAGLVLFGFEAFGSFEVDAAKGAGVVFGKRLLDLPALVVGEVGVLVELGGQALDLFKLLDKGDAGVVAPEVWHGIGAGFQPMRLEEVVQFLPGGLKLFNYHRGLVHQPDFLGLFGACAGEQGDGFINVGLLAAKVEDVAVGLGGVEDAVGTGKGLDEAVVLEVFIDVEGVKVFGVEAGQEHVHDNCDVDLLRALLGEVGGWGIAGP